jgi:nitroreductase
MAAGNNRMERILIVVLAFVAVASTATVVKMKFYPQKAELEGKAEGKAEGGDQKMDTNKTDDQKICAPESNVKDTLTIIHQRKSVRKYLDKPVSDAMLDTLVKAGMAAPTAGNKQPWYFITVTDRTMLMKLAGTHDHTGMLATAGAAIVVIGAPDESLRGASGQMWIQDCSAAIENILLATEAMDLGAVWLGVYPVEERVQFVRDTLAIPPEFVPMSILSIGWPTGEELPKDKYKPEKIFKNSWGSK